MQDLKAIAEDSVSIRVSWRIPAQPNGMITQYRLQVLVVGVLLQDITLTAEVSQVLQLCIEALEMFVYSIFTCKAQHATIRHFLIKLVLQ